MTQGQDNKEIRLGVGIDVASVSHTVNEIQKLRKELQGLVQDSQRGQQALGALPTLGGGGSPPGGYAAQVNRQSPSQAYSSGGTATGSLYAPPPYRNSTLAPGTSYQFTSGGAAGVYYGAGAQTNIHNPGNQAGAAFSSQVSQVQLQGPGNQADVQATQANSTAIGELTRAVTALTTVFGANKATGGGGGGGPTDGGSFDGGGTPGAPSARDQRLGHWSARLGAVAGGVGAAANFAGGAANLVQDFKTMGIRNQAAQGGLYQQIIGDLLGGDTRSLAMMQNKAFRDQFGGQGAYQAMNAAKIAGAGALVAGGVAATGGAGLVGAAVGETTGSALAAQAATLAARQAGMSAIGSGGLGLSERVAQWWSGDTKAKEAQTLLEAERLSKVANPLENMAYEQALSMAPHMARANRRLGGRAEEAFGLASGYGISGMEAVGLAESLAGEASTGRILGQRTPTQKLAQTREAMGSELAKIQAEEARVWSNEGGRHLTTYGKSFVENQDGDPTSRRKALDKRFAEYKQNEGRLKQAEGDSGNYVTSGSLVDQILGLTNLGLGQDEARGSMVAFNGRLRSRGASSTIQDLMSLNVGGGGTQAGGGHFANLIQSLADQSGRTTSEGYGALGSYVAGSGTATSYDRELGVSGASRLNQVGRSNPYYRRVGIAEDVSALNQTVGVGKWDPGLQSVLGNMSWTDKLAGNYSDRQRLALGEEGLAAAKASGAGMFRNMLGNLGVDRSALEGEGGARQRAIVAEKMAARYGMSGDEAEAILDQQLNRKGGDRGGLTSGSGKSAGGTDYDQPLKDAVLVATELMKEAPKAMEKFKVQAEAVQAFFNQLKEQTTQGNLQVGDVISVRIETMPKDLRGAKPPGG